MRFKSLFMCTLSVLLFFFLPFLDSVTGQYRSTKRSPPYEENLSNSDPYESNRVRDAQQQQPIRYDLTNDELANNLVRSNSHSRPYMNESSNRLVWPTTPRDKPSQATTSGNTAKPTTSTSLAMSISLPSATSTQTNTNAHSATNTQTNTNAHNTTNINAYTVTATDKSTTCLPCLVGNEPNDVIKSYISKAVKDVPSSSTTSIWVVLAILLIVVTAFVMPMLIYLYLNKKQRRRGSMEDGRQGISPRASTQSDSPGDSPLSEAFGVTTSQSTNSPPPPQAQQYSQPNSVDAKSHRSSRDKSKSMRKLSKNTVPMFKRITLS